jgi:hypothetical protein
VGKGNAQKEAVLVSCAEEVQGRANDQQACDWFVPPAKPGSAKAQVQARRQSALAADLAQSGFPALPDMCNLIGGEGGTLTCSPFQHRLGG